MNVLFFIASIFLFIWTIRNIFYWVHLWQLKEYRLDRLIAHLLETKQGKTIFFSPKLLAKIILFVGYGYLVFHSDLLLSYQVFVTALFALDTATIVNELRKHRLQRPFFTVKAMLLVFVPFVLILVFYRFPLFEEFFWLLVLDRLSPFLIAGFVLFLALPSEVYRDFKTQQARSRLKEYQVQHKKPLLTIGVTGSYGKSSTKEYTAQILEKKFHVLKTKGSNNTLIGVITTVLQGLKKSTEIFVAEIGAYKRGEIAQICAVIRPTIGILTAVSDQHLSLFGSLENTMKAKYELIESLPKNGIAMFNGNNENSFLLYKKTDKKRVLYQCFQSMRDLNTVLRMSRAYANESVVAFNVVSSKTSVSFHVFLRNRLMHVTAPLLGGHVVENLLPAIYLADYFGMDEKEIKKAVSTLTPLPKTMVRSQLKTGVSLIDDTFNTNSAAVLASISYMKVYKGKKILVLQPLIELGKRAKQEHYELGQAIAKVCDTVFLTSANYFSFLEKGVHTTNKKCKIKVMEPSAIAKFITKYTGSEDVVVFEGKEAGNVLDLLI